MSIKEAVYTWIDKNQDEVVTLLQKLIKEPSVNPYFDEEKIICRKEGHKKS